MTLDPKKRIIADGALNHEYFRSGVKIVIPRFMPKLHHYRMVLPNAELGHGFVADPTHIVGNGDQVVIISLNTALH